MIKLLHLLLALWSCTVADCFLHPATQNCSDDTLWYRYQAGETITLQCPLAAGTSYEYIQWTMHLTQISVCTLEDSPTAWVCSHNELPGWRVSAYIQDSIVTLNLYAFPSVASEIIHVTGRRGNQSESQHRIPPGKVTPSLGVSPSPLVPSRMTSPSLKAGAEPNDKLGHSSKMSDKRDPSKQANTSTSKRSSAITDKITSFSSMLDAMAQKSVPTNVKKGAYGQTNTVTRRRGDRKKTSGISRRFANSPCGDIPRQLVPGAGRSAPFLHKSSAQRTKESKDAHAQQAFGDDVLLCSFCPFEVYSESGISCRAVDLEVDILTVDCALESSFSSPICELAIVPEQPSKQRDARATNSLREAVLDPASQLYHCLLTGRMSEGRARYSVIVMDRWHPRTLVTLVTFESSSVRLESDCTRHVYQGQAYVLRERTARCTCTATGGMPPSGIARWLKAYWGFATETNTSSSTLQIPWQAGKYVHHTS
ncbi:uncharacterized protein LOC101864052 [Aplysia californica]|uniref:Uncharacterized protein LOC101864052 n=1 Tax=Aplysia californica TaxID=6500 RepID=A0ABM0ZVY3_APLCA|nr:uncharacterized protein LOC101864052 [Aplysia californica]